MRHRAGKKTGTPAPVEVPEVEAPGRKVCPLCTLPVLPGQSAAIIYPQAKTGHRGCRDNREAVTRVMSPESRVTSQRF